MLVGKGSYNDTFAMTRKDEELLVGAILQKIVVPHPAVTNLEAIEVSYNICDVSLYMFAPSVQLI